MIELVRADGLRVRPREWKAYELSTSHTLMFKCYGVPPGEYKRVIVGKRSYEKKLVVPKTACPGGCAYTFTLLPANTL